LCKLTTHTIEKISEYCKRWLDLDGEQSTIAANAAKRIERWSLHSESGALGCEIASEIANARYHKECYVHFCDKTKVERGEKRMRKE
jgi:hypothetical protein